MSDFEDEAIPLSVSAIEEIVVRLTRGILLPVGLRSKLSQVIWVALSRCQLCHEQDTRGSEIFCEKCKTEYKELHDTALSEVYVAALISEGSAIRVLTDKPKRLMKRKPRES